MKQILNQLFDHKHLSREQAYEVMKNIASSQYNESQVAAFITVYLMRSISVGELAGFRDALLELCISMDFGDRQTIDLCGTGGDGQNTFNISTLASFVVAGAGYKVAKHGNYGVSSVCGSSNVLEKLGYQFTNDQTTLTQQIDAAGICFLHAPMFHPAMKSVGPIRKKLGVKTFFNMLGPLVNPARPQQQLIGVFSLKLARMYQYLHQNSTKRYTIVHAIDGYDEVSLTGDVKQISNIGEKVSSPASMGFERLKKEDIFGGDTVGEASEIFTKVLSGRGTKAQEAVVVANAACAIQCFDQQKGFEDCVKEAQESLESGKAQIAFKTLIS